ncbi:MAG: hypothetical protein IKE32_03270, partial [Aeriscardovia sp.]|nr:hypothetical protein [Aeriscardovia sp.]
MALDSLITLSDDFIARQTAALTPHWGPLGWVTYKRTYARFLEDQERTEEWAETVKRVVEGNINLDPRLHTNKQADRQVVEELTEEAEDLFRLIYGLAATPSGRNLWVSGTDYQKAHGDSLNNCWMIAIRPQNYGNSEIVPTYLKQSTMAASMPWAFMFDELMKGGGVGFSVTHDNVSKMPQVSRQVELVCLIDAANPSAEEACEAGAADRAEWIAENGNPGQQADCWYYRLEDSREGWVRALAAVIDSHFDYFPDGVRRVVLDMS